MNQIRPIITRKIADHTLGAMFLHIAAYRHDVDSARVTPEQLVAASELVFADGHEHTGEDEAGLRRDHARLMQAACRVLHRQIESHGMGVTEP